MTREDLIRTLEALPYGMEIRCAAPKIRNDGTVKAHDIQSVGTWISYIKNEEQVIGIIYFTT